MIYGDELFNKIKKLSEKESLSAEDQGALKAYQDSLRTYLKCKDERIQKDMLTER